MKKIIFIISLFILSTSNSFGAHIKGGFFNYEYLGPGTGTNLRYRITLTVYMICDPNPGQLSNPINFSIFDAGNNAFIQNASVSITQQYNLAKTQDEICITGDQTGCYYTVVIYDLASIELPATPSGYIVSYQRCCRIAGINNIVSSGAVGNTFAITIPGTASGFETNSSPAFAINDTAVVCAGSYFQYSFKATDKDVDSLAYTFCSAYQGASQGDPSPATASNPPYSSVPYQSPFTGFSPMGIGVTINPLTGLISGVAPAATGEYVVCVCVNEYRNGVLIGTTRKELHIRVGDCNPLTALLNPRPTFCEGLIPAVVSFQNDAAGNPPGVEYVWEFGDPTSGALNTSTLASPTHTYADTGTYTIKLKVSLSGGMCSDSTTLKLKVYPGFFPGFVYNGSCFTTPYQFTDTTKTTYGTVSIWSWNFGDLATLADTSHIFNPQWTYPSPGTKTVTLIVGNSKGCVDTLVQTVDILDKPAIAVAFNDTLICIPDAVQLNATGTGTFSWTPLVNIVGANTATPSVNPTTDTWYYVKLTDNGCENNDSVHVRVVSGVTLNARADTAICLTDPVQLSATGNALSYQWTPSATLSDPNIANPIATPVSAITTYTVRGNIGTCFTTDNVIVAAVPYPQSNAGPNQVICYNTATQLNGLHDGSSFTWTPTSYLDNPTILNPIATPPRTITYVLSSYDTKGCPKPGRDTIVVTVNPKVIAFAGNDTVAVVGQPLQLLATGGTSYIWSPAIGLNNTNIANPVGTYNNSIDSVKYKVIVTDDIGCADSAFVKVVIYKVLPTVFVPTAFTPNNDGLNDVVAPFIVGIRKLNFFSIYNRWGERVFSTTQNKKGWDGTIGGRLQNTGVFVWMVSAEDYNGQKIFLKGTVTLIR